MKILKKMVCVLGVAGALATGAVQAEGTGSGPNPFSDCGIGAALFPKHPVGAVISNVIWDVGTTAVTSATASPETCNGKAAQTAAFIYETYDNLVEDTARGEGSHLATLMSLMNVAESEQDAVVTELRASYAHLITSAKYSEMTDVEKAEQLYLSSMAAAS